MNKKALSGVVATSLIIVVAVISTIGFQGWFNDYSSQTFVNVEQKQIKSISFEASVGDFLYLNSNEITNFDLFKIQNSKGDEVCSFSKTKLKNFSSQTILLLDMDYRNSTHILDLSGYNNHCKIYTTNCDVDGINGKGCYFDGVDDYLDCGNSSSLSFEESFSTVVWFKPEVWNDGITNGRTLINKFDYIAVDQNYGWALGHTYYPKDGMTFVVEGLSGRNIFWDKFNVSKHNNQWNLAAGIFDSTKEARMHFNNNLSMINSSVIGNFTNTPHHLYIGKRSSGPYGPFHGVIDEVLLTRDILTIDEINFLIEHKNLMRDEQILTKGISKINISTCNLNKNEVYNLVVLGENSYHGEFIAK